MAAVWHSLESGPRKQSSHFMYYFFFFTERDLFTLNAMWRLELWVGERRVFGFESLLRCPQTLTTSSSWGDCSFRALRVFSSLWNICPVFPSIRLVRCFQCYRQGWASRTIDRRMNAWLCTLAFVGRQRILTLLLLRWRQPWLTATVEKIKKKRFLIGKVKLPSQESIEAPLIKA